jgi:tRNA-Thr(GGU) m(6)t(6)A37 methyltransferase TsaA
MSISFKSIGTIHTPFKTKEGMPIQSKAATGIKGQIMLEEEFVLGLKDLDGFSHIILLYYFHQSDGYALQTTPFLDKQIRGVFSTRAPKRPNAIGMSVVKLLGVENNILSIENVDMMDGTPLLDIKPYVPDFDTYENTSVGWVKQSAKKLHTIKSDKRFE